MGKCTSARARMLALSGALAVLGSLVHCGGDDAGIIPPEDGGPDAAQLDGSASSDGGDATSGHPALQLATDAIDFGLVGCGGAAATAKTIKLQNTGDGPLTFDASFDASSPFFLIGMTSGSVAAGQSVSLTIAANAIAATTAAGTVQSAKLTVTTNDPAHASVSIAVKQTAGGATLSLMPAQAAFGSVPVGTQAQDVALTLKNTGNQPVTLAFSQPSDTEYALTWTGAPAEVTVAPGATVPGLTARFKPTAAATTSTTAILAPTGALCATSLGAIPMSGTGSAGAFSAQPGSIDFGQVACGTTSALPAPQRTITISNSGNARFTWSASLGRGNGSPFTLATSGTTVAPNATGTIVVNPKAIPATSAVTDDLYGDTIAITTDIPGDTQHTVPITETASGAILAFTPQGTLALGNVPLNATASGPFTVTNQGNAPATVTASVSNMPVFTIDATALGAIAAQDSAQDGANFTPTAATAQSAKITLAVDAADVLCAPLPSLDLTGTGTNGQVLVSPASVDFGQVDCGTRAMTRTVTLQNTGNGAFSFNAAIVGPSFTVTPAMGTVNPGASATLTVTPIAIPQQSDVTPDLYGDTLTVTTDAAGDTQHSVPLHMTARGVILTASTNAIDFGGVRINTTATSQLTVSNAGNVAAPGVTFTNPVAQFTFAPQGSTIAASANATIVSSFAPTQTMAYSDQASISVANGTVLCAPLPPNVALTGTGTDGLAVVAPTNLDFGRVLCGTTASGQGFTITNNGNATFNWTASLTQGSSFYMLGASSGAVDPGNAANVSVDPVAIPSTSQTTPDLYAGEITVTTDVAGDTPHRIALHESASGARLTIDVMTLDFGTVAVGDSSSRAFRVTNSGDLAATVVTVGYQNPPFSVAPDNVPLAGGGVLDALMTFAPQQAGAVSGQTLSLQTTDPLCLPLPAAVTLTATGQ